LKSRVVWGFPEVRYDKPRRGLSAAHPPRVSVFSTCSCTDHTASTDLIADTLPLYSSPGSSPSFSNPSASSLSSCSSAKPPFPPSSTPSTSPPSAPTASSTCSTGLYARCGIRMSMSCLSSSACCRRRYMWILRGCIGHGNGSS